VLDVALPRLRAFVAIACILSTGTPCEASPYEADVNLFTPQAASAAQRRAVRDLSAPDRQKIAPVRFRARAAGLGSVTFSFDVQRSVNWPATFGAHGRNDELVPVLLQGQARLARAGGRAKAQRVAVAASIEGSHLKAQVISQRKRRRLYTITMKLDGSLSIRARSTSIAQGALGALGCANHEMAELSAQINSSAHASSETSPSVAEQTATFREVTISTQADAEWYQKYGERSNALIASFVNSADVIYRSQLRITLKLIRQHVYTGPSVLTSSNPGTLLTQFSDNPENAVNLSFNPATFYQDVDLRHLFTGKDLEGSVVGIAYLSVACAAPELSTGLTQDFGENATWAIFAHEIGHNFGAQHDTSDRASLMFPSIAVPPPDRFSATSVAQVGDHLGKYADRCMALVEGELPIIQPNITPTPQIPTAPNPESPGGLPTPKPELPFDPAGAEIVLRSREFADTLGTYYRLGGLYTDASGNPASQVVVTLFAEGRVVATATTDSTGRYRFFVQVKAPQTRRVSVWIADEAGGAVSNVLRLRRSV
jgi:hypothetical protein